nr:flagellar basal-body MS-ring/collar protein FliF [Pseudovibrio flavus]
MAGISVILLGIFGFVIFRATAPQMVPLFTDLSLEDSASVVAELESTGSTFEIRGDGSSIYVSQKDVHGLRMKMAQAGLPTGGGVGYEIFDRTDTLGATTFVQNINHLRALEGELARTIRAIDRVASARVHLVLPQRQLFQRDQEPPTASIVLKVRGSLDGGHIRAIQHLVASAVEGLEPNFVSVVDERGALLASGVGEEAQGWGSSSMEERRLAMETRLRQQVEDILHNVVGAGRARVRVAAEINYNRKTETQELFDPDGQVIRSRQSKEESSSSQAADNGVTVANQLPNAGGADGGFTGDRDNASIAEELVNYEISKSTVTMIEEAGGVKRLSIAVLVDGSYVPDGEGAPVYQERSPQELDRIAALVRTAVGFDDRRGDTLEVVNMRFVDVPQEGAVSSSNDLLAFTKYDIMRFAELGVLLVVSLLMLLFAVRPLMRQVLAKDKEEEKLLSAPASGEAGAVSGAEGAAATGGLAGLLTFNEDGTPVVPAFDWIEDAKNEAAIHANSIKEIGGMIDEMPKEAVNIVRSWLNEAA